MGADIPVRVLCAQDECERGYNLKAAFPDFPEVLRQWQTATATVQASLLTTPDIAYGDGRLQGFDYYQAAGHACPLLIFIHGGYWQGGDKSDIGFIAAPYVNAGISVAVMNYSLAPSATIEAMIDEVSACLAYIVAHAALLDIDVTRISLMGHSAGAHLAAYVATTTHSVPVHAVFAISGVFDLLPLLPTTINHALRLGETRANDLSPVLLNGPGKTQVHTIIGANETRQFHLQSAVLAQCWSQVVAHHVVPDTHHYTVLLPLADATNKVCQTIIRAVH
jgi:arylformamidase